MTPLPPDQFGPVVITAREIYDAVIRVSTQVGQVAQQVTYMAERQADHDKRIAALESSRWPLPSIAALASVASIAAIVLAFVPH